MIRSCMTQELLRENVMIYRELPFCIYVDIDMKKQTGKYVRDSNIRHRQIPYPGRLIPQYSQGLNNSRQNKIYPKPSAKSFQNAKSGNHHTKNPIIQKRRHQTPSRISKDRTSHNAITIIKGYHRHQQEPSQA